MTDIVTRLRACLGEYMPSDVTVPHTLLRDAVEEIERLRALATPPTAAAAAQRDMANQPVTPADRINPQGMAADRVWVGAGQNGYFPYRND